MASRITLPFPKGVSDRLSGLTTRRRMLVTILPLLLIAAALFFLNRGLRGSVGPDEVFGSFDMPYVQTFDEVAVNRWFSHDGTWALQQGALVQTDPEVQSAQLFVPRWLEEGTPYRLSAAIRLPEAARAAGLNFNAQYPEIATRHHRVYLVRENGRLELVTGYIDEGGEFQTQTRMPVEQVAEQFELQVIVEEAVYHVQLNGRAVVENRPLAYQDGLVGLYASGGPVTFDDLSLKEMDGAYIAGAALDGGPGGVVAEGGLLYTSNFAAQSGNEGWVPFTGDWQMKDDRLTQLDPDGFDLGIGYESAAFESYVLRASFSHRFGQGAGVLFNMPSPYQLAGAHMVRYSERSNNLLWGYFDEAGAFQNQGYAPVDAPGEGEHVLTVDVTGESYSVLLDGQAVVGSVPLVSRAGHVGLVTAQSTAAFSLVEVSARNGAAPQQTNAAPTTTAPAEQPAPQTEAQPTPKPVPVDGRTEIFATGGAPGANVDYAIRGELVDANADTAWLPFAGEWQVEGDELRQVERNGYDLATGYAGATFQNYTLGVTLRHLEGQGAGVLFNMASPDTVNGSHMVRYSDTADGVFWGFYDDTGKFVGQGYARVSPAGTDDHTFVITSGETSYSVTLDGQTLARDVQLNRNSGAIGLIASQSAVAYGPIEVSDGRTASDPVAQGTAAGPGTAAPVAAPAPVAADEEYRPLSGDWERDGTTIRQTNEAIYDFINSTSTFAGVYTLEVDITMPEDPALAEAGGGIIFHMPERDKRNGGVMVRFTGPKSLTWGSYATDGSFIGAGKGEIKEAALKHTLMLKVREGQYDVVVDGIVVVAGVPLQASEGWIGLLAHRGPITFDNIRITLGN